MARKAARESEENEIVELVKPDFDRAIGIITNDIVPAEEKNATSRGDLSAAWKVIEDDCHVNKQAAKQYKTLAKMSDEKRDDYLRSLYGLMEAGGVGISADLVDRMETDGETPEMPVKPTGPKLGLVTLEKDEGE